MEPGQEIPATVTGITPFAVFVQVGDVPGLVRHRPEAGDTVAVDGTVTVRITDYDAAERRFAASFV